MSLFTSTVELAVENRSVNSKEMTSTVNYEFVDKVPEDHICSICTNVLTDPLLVECCGQLFCEECLIKWLQKQKTCPHCRKKNFNFIKDLRMKRLINGSKIYCPNRFKGCEKIITVGECSTHLETCLFVEVPCTNNCGVKMLRKELQNHTANECPKRKVNCQYCNEEGMYKDITAQGHIDECPSFPLDCPNNCGHDNIQRKDLSDHQKECPCKLAKCPFFEAGCKQEIPQNKLATHKTSNTENHLELMMTNLKETKDEMNFKFSCLASCVTMQLATIDSNPRNAAAITNIKTALEAMTTILEPDKEYYLPLFPTAEGIKRTPSFYIQPGYKMYINEQCKLFLERSKFDNTLIWPMTANEFMIKNNSFQHKIIICSECSSLIVNKVESDQTEREIWRNPFYSPLGDSVPITVKSHIH